MNNERIISVTPVEEPTAPKKINLKLVFVIAGGVVLLAAIIFLVITFFSEKAEFVEDGGKSLPNLSESKYVDLKDYDLSLEGADSDFETEIQEKIMLFFTYLKPEMKTLTMVSSETSESLSESEDDASGSYRVSTLTFKSDTGERFAAKVFTDIPSTYKYELIIEDASGKEIYSYTAGDITKDLYADAEYDSLLDVILDKLPHTGELESGAKFEITYEGEDGDRLTVSPAGSSFSTEDCKNALSAAADWANSLELKYSKEITENNFACEL